MDFSSAFRRLFSQRKRRETGNRENFSVRRLRLFETLEARQMLDAASFYETLPEIITIAETDQTYHYAIEGKSFEIIRTETDNFVGYTDFLCSVSGENGCDDVLYTPYFFTFSERLNALPFLNS